MNRRQALSALTLPLLLGGCYYDTAALRFRLTLMLDTPDGIKSGTVVNFKRCQDVSIFGLIGGGCAPGTGEAVYVDLGKGERPLLAIRTWGQDKKRNRLNWVECIPALHTLLRRFGVNEPPTDLMQQVRLLKQRQGQVLELTPDDLPLLATFEDVKDPSSIIAVDPDDLRASLQQTVSWHRITVEVTKDEVTRTIEKKLPWLPAYNGKFLDGTKGGRHVAGLSPLARNGAQILWSP